MPRPEALDALAACKLLETRRITTACAPHDERSAGGARASEEVSFRPGTWFSGDVPSAVGGYIARYPDDATYDDEVSPRRGFNREGEGPFTLWVIGSKARRLVMTFATSEPFPPEKKRELFDLVEGL